MNLIQSVCALGPIDLKNVNRDPMLRWMIFIPVILGLLFRWFVPWAAGQVNDWLDFNLMEYRVLIISLFVMLIPVIYGSVVGFLLLDQRDDRTISALQVTPLTLRGYFLYRISIPILMGLLGNLVMLPISGLSTLGFWQLLLLCLSASGLTPLYALFYAGFTHNKVQGFALMKISGFIFLPVLAAYFLSGIWHWLFAILPPFWPMKLTWVLENGEPLWIFYFVVGLIVQGLCLHFLLRRFLYVLER